MKTNAQPENLTLYLLHFSPPVGGASHYLGITKTTNLQKRLQRHTRGYGASLTYRARAQGASVYLAATWANASFKMEREFKWRGHFKKLCPLCADPTGDTTLQPLKLLPTTRLRSNQLELLAWTTTAPTNQPPN